MSKIQWTTETWNPTVGCSVKSAGCINCYAKYEAHRMAGNPNPKISSVYQGLTERKSDRIEWTGVVKFLPERLEKPLKTKKPTTWFIDSMSDLFHESVPYEWIDQVFAVMALTPQHTYQVLTKRPDRMLEYFEWGERRHDSMGKPVSFCRVDVIEQICINSASDNIPRPSFEIKQFPLPNVWLGASCENQQEADTRIPFLLKTPAVVRFLSCEPLLGAINLAPSFVNVKCQRNTKTGAIRLVSIFEEEEIHRDAILTNYSQTSPNHRKPIDWVIVGGESGHNARPCNIEWIRSIVSQCKEAGVPVFVKQLGSNCHSNLFHPYKTKDKKAGDINEFPEDLRVREFPR